MLGYDAADQEVQRAFGDLQVVIVGEWLVESQGENVLIYSSPDIPRQLSYARRLDVTDAARVEPPFVGGEVFGLRGFRVIREDFDGITVVTSGILPDEEFRQRIAEIDQFAPEPGMLARNVYEVFRIVIPQKTTTTNQTPTKNTEDTPQNPIQREPTTHTYSLNTNGYLTTPTTP